MERDQTLALLADTHVFPGPYTLRVIVRPGGQAPVVTAIAAWCADGRTVEHVEERPSSGGKWIALRLRVFVIEPEDVLQLNEVVAQIDAVVMTL